MLEGGTVIYSAEGKGKRRFVDSCDIVETLQTLKVMLRRSRGTKEGLALMRSIELLEIVRQDIGIAKECIIEAGGRE